MIIKKILAFFLLVAALSIAASQEKVQRIVQLEVISGDLFIRSYSHEVYTGEKSIACVSYVSDGLERHGQSEIVLTLPRKGLREDVPQDVIEIFKSIHAGAESGQLVNDYDVFIMKSGQSFLGRRGDWGFFFIPAEVLEGVDVPFKALAAVLAKGYEVDLLKKGLSYRVASMLGAKYGYYPCPFWSEPERKSLLSSKDFEKSLMAEADWSFARGLSVRMSIDSEEQNEIVLTVDLSGLPQLNALLAQPTTTDSILLRLLTIPDPSVTTRLAWLRGSDTIRVITAFPGPWVTGGFLMLVSKEGIEEKGYAAEDGFVVCLNPTSLEKLKSSMAGAIPTAFPLGRQGGRLRTEFLRRFFFDELVEQAYTIVGVHDYQAYSVLRARVEDVGSVEDYIKALNGATLTALKDSKQYDAHGILIAVGVKPGKKVRIWCEAIEGSLPEGILQNLKSSLENIPTVEVKDGPIAFALCGILWNREVKEFPDMPVVWRKALAESGKNLTVPDGLFELIWAD